MENNENEEDKPISENKSAGSLPDYNPELAKEITEEGQKNLKELQQVLGETPDEILSEQEYSEQLIQDGFRKDSQEYSSLMAFHRYLEETPQEELERQWKEIEESGIGSEGPTVEEYFASLNPNYMYQKGYTEGATKFKESLEKKLQTEFGEDEERFRNRVINIMNEIYENE